MLEDLWSKCCKSRHRVYARVFCHWDYDARLNVYNSRNYLYNTGHIEHQLSLASSHSEKRTFDNFWSLPPVSSFTNTLIFFWRNIFFRGGGGGFWWSPASAARASVAKIESSSSVWKTRKGHHQRHRHRRRHLRRRRRRRRRPDPSQFSIEVDARNTD